ncbi:MAG: glycerol-3-phosphate 1-O-acyltransferase PlsY [Oscillospiraceae bacterium]|nr:glycerol-3-phosphate 1-O-acyltransferase PlsY [Oscillospiraceae bacterium]
MEKSILYALSSVIAYLLGSINFAIIITRVFYRKDIRSYGSGNAGMTNVLRNFGKLPAALTLIGDLGKGIAAILIARMLCPLIITDYVQGGVEYQVASYGAAFFALFGHIRPLFHGFKGGKGILTTAGVLIVLDPVIFLILLGIFAIIVLISRIVSLASIIAAAAYPLWTVAMMIPGDPSQIIVHAGFSSCIAAIIILMHRENISRLLKGTEHKFGK